MSANESDMVIGYSVFDTLEECYQYNENACFIGDSRQSARDFLRESCSDAQDCRIDAGRFRDIMQDYGSSCGDYTMEREAFFRFTKTAERNAVKFKAEAYDGDDSLMVVEIEGVSRPYDE